MNGFPKLAPLTRHPRGHTGLTLDLRSCDTEATGVREAKRVQSAHGVSDIWGPVRTLAVCGFLCQPQFTQL
jgi:hypothetical protein